MRKAKKAKATKAKAKAKAENGRRHKARELLPAFRPMEPVEYRAVMREMGWQQADVAARLHLGRRTIRRAANGEARIDGPSTALMRLMAEGVVTPEEVARAMARLFPIRRAQRRRPAVDARADPAHNPRPRGRPRLNDGGLQ